MSSPKETLEKLLEGNKRFAEGKSTHPNLGEEIREMLLSQQDPSAVVISCSDSRVPVEIIFDSGIGDIFVIRTAGHVLSKEVLGSIEYAVKKLNVNLVMVLGHDDCGAIKAALNSYKINSYRNLTENLKSILNHIYPAFERLDFQNCESNLIDCAIKSNINYQYEDLLKKDKYLASKVKKEKIMLVKANYNLKTGLVEIIK